MSLVWSPFHHGLTIELWIDNFFGSISSLILETLTKMATNTLTYWPFTHVEIIIGKDPYILSKIEYLIIFFSQFIFQIKKES